MKPNKPLRKFLLLAFAALLVAVPLVPALAQGPIGDLTVTVQERADGGVDFSLSGSTSYKQEGDFWTVPTNWSPLRKPPTPDSIPYSNVALPPGLQFLVGGTPVAVTTYYTTGGIWQISVDGSSSFAAEGTPISGSGMIEVPGIPFTNFVDGAFVVEHYLFDVTYRVFPYVAPAPAPAPGRASLRVPRRQRLPATEIGRSSRPARIAIANVGDVPVERISVALRGPGSRSFRIAGGAARRLDPAATTAFRVACRPVSSRPTRARAVVRSSAPRESTLLIGRGLRPKTAGPRKPPLASQ